MDKIQNKIEYLKFCNIMQITMVVCVTRPFKNWKQM